MSDIIDLNLNKVKRANFKEGKCLATDKEEDPVVSCLAVVSHRRSRAR